MCSAGPDKWILKKNVYSGRRVYAVSKSNLNGVRAILFSQLHEGTMKDSLNSQKFRGIWSIKLE